MDLMLRVALMFRNMVIWRMVLMIQFLLISVMILMFRMFFRVVTVFLCFCWLREIWNKKNSRYDLEKKEDVNIHFQSGNSGPSRRELEQEEHQPSIQAFSPRLFDATWWEMSWRHEISPQVVWARRERLGTRLEEHHDLERKGKWRRNERWICANILKICTGHDKNVLEVENCKMLNA